ncbi:MAG: hypothetical protein JSU86_02885, partial [Phycisphaerales bacterium]
MLLTQMMGGEVSVKGILGPILPAVYTPCVVKRQSAEPQRILIYSSFSSQAGYKTHGTSLQQWHFSHCKISLLDGQEPAQKQLPCPINKRRVRDGG